MGMCDPYLTVLLKLNVGDKRGEKCFINCKARGTGRRRGFGEEKKKKSIALSQNLLKHHDKAPGMRKMV